MLNTIASVIKHLPGCHDQHKHSGKKGQPAAGSELGSVKDLDRWDSEAIKNWWEAAGNTIAYEEVKRDYLDDDDSELEMSDKYTDEEGLAIDRYAGDEPVDYVDINHILRYPDPIDVRTGRYSDIVASLDSAIGKNVLSEDLIVYRGVSLSDRDLNLNHWVEPGYGSASLNVLPAKIFASYNSHMTSSEQGGKQTPVIRKVLLLKGSHALIVSLTDNREIIPERGLTYKVIEQHMNKDKVLEQTVVATKDPIKANL